MNKLHAFIQGPENFSWWLADCMECSAQCWDVHQGIMDWYRAVLKNRDKDSISIKLFKVPIYMYLIGLRDSKNIKTQECDELGRMIYNLLVPYSGWYQWVSNLSSCRTVALRKFFCWQTGLSTNNFPESYSFFSHWRCRCTIIHHEVHVIV